MAQDGPSALETAEPPRTAQSAPQMYPNATQFGLHAAQLTNVQGQNYNLNVNQMPPTVPSFAVLGPQQGQQALQTAAPNTPSSQPAVSSVSGNYSTQLLCQGRGFPLYVPKAVTIGDVGRVTTEGSFKVFFNIYDSNIPRDLVSLPPFDPKDVDHEDFDPGNWVASPSVHDTNDGVRDFPGGQFVFGCRGPDGAVLALPRGAHQAKLTRLKSLRQYAAKYAESWYKYVNETREIELVNGSLYLVTGYETAQSYGMASFHHVSARNEFQLSFKPTTGADNGYRYRWQAPNCHSKHWPPAEGVALNKTTFIHAFAISVCESILGKLFGAEVCQLVDSTTFPDMSRRTFVPYGSQGSSFGWSLLFGSSGSAGGKQRTGQTLSLGSGIVSDAAPIPPIFHPSQIIHERLLREAPKAKVVITHDDDWRDVFKDNPTKNPSELQQAIFDHFEIMEEEGAVFLMPKSRTTGSMNIPAMEMTVEEEHREYGRTTADDLDNTKPFSARALRDMEPDQRRERNDTVDAEVNLSPHSPVLSPSPGPPDTCALASQVGGHPDGVVTAADDTLLIKAALPLELKFYQTVAAASEPEFDALRPFIPKFIGTLSLGGALDTDMPPSEGSINVNPVGGVKKESIVLENLVHPFAKPNILDIKLGTVFYDESASPEKVERMIKTAETTTSLSTGVRLTGFQVYNNLTGEAVHTSKAYGKSISAAQLPEGIARFFPIATADAPAQGLPASVLLQILELLREDVQDIRDAFAALEMRMVGGSLLIIYESDAARAEEGLKWLLRDDDEDEEDSDSDDEEDDAKKPPKSPYDVRLIDFAHTRFVPGQGPDEGVLLGFKTILNLLDDRIKAVRTCV